MDRIGVVGTGRMGANMARRLQDTGYTVAACYDRQSESSRALSDELVCTPAQSLAEVTAQSDVVLTVVTDDAAMGSIFAPSGDSLLHNAAGKYFVNCATLSPAAHIEAARAAEAAGANALEACMASSVTQARAGTLYLMCAGPRDVFDRLRPLLEKLGNEPRYIGEAGQAAKLKALVNMVMNINTAGLAEGLGLASALGLNLNMVREVFAQTGANSRVLETDGEDMQNRDHAVYFSAEHAAKDSGIALGLARETGLDLPLASATLAQYSKMKELGLGDLDKSGISELTFKDRAPR